MGSFTTALLLLYYCFTTTQVERKRIDSMWAAALQELEEDTHAHTQSAPGNGGGGGGSQLVDSVSHACGVTSCQLVDSYLGSQELIPQQEQRASANEMHKVSEVSVTERDAAVC